MTDKSEPAPPIATTPLAGAADGNRAKSLFFEALERLDARDYVEAETRLRAALQLAPGRPSVLINLAAALFSQHKTDEALSYAGKALAVEADNAQALLLVGNCLIRQKKFVEAVRPLKQIVAVNAGDAEAWVSLAIALAGSDRPEESSEAYRTAEAQLRAALATAPEAPAVMTNLAGCLLGQDRLDEAIKYARGVLAIEAGRSGGHANRRQGAFATASFRRGSIDLAASCCGVSIGCRILGRAWPCARSDEPARRSG